ncbi:hypothetical protein SAMN05216241_103134 [Limimonas halophila]|uniref:MOSC domain-containing protein n=1 Tax=Limimonas halophila TaxID=1082479 RepID=A0A1G7PYC0_9PROT|nr:MOSC domain-containing protein [Limimonas halophila]SDF91317.1 hypothetical protein SAMN05216241_103134 [Limimonas halophila]
MTPRVTRIRRYPVKGLSGEDLERVELTAGQTLPGDRRFAIARGSADLPPVQPGWAPKKNFVQLARTARLGQLQTAFDADTGLLTISRRGKRITQGRITTATGRMVIEQFLGAFLAGEVSTAPRLVDAQDTPLTDSQDAVVSLINLESVRDLRRVLGHEVDPRRFRANVYLDGLPAWAERAWVGEAVTIGPLRLQVTEETQRCAATTVNPDTGERDEQIPKALKRGYGHVNMGVYARVTVGGPLTVGDPVSVPETVSA